MFERPLVLAVLALAPLAAAPGLAAMRHGKALFGALTAALRLAIFVLLVLMLAGLRIAIRSAAQRSAVIVALDESRSIAPDQFDWMRARAGELAARMDPRDLLGVLAFGRDVRMLMPLGDPRLVRSLERLADPGGTDIAGAITAAGGLFPPEAEKKLVLLSDGNETQGSALAELPSISEQGVEVFALAPPPPATGRLALTGFEAPQRVRANASFAFRIDVQSEARRPVQTHIKVERDGAEVGRHPLKLHSGLNRFELPYRMDRPGAYLMRVEIEPTPGMFLLGARAELALLVTDPPRVLVVSKEPPESLLNALKLRRYRVERAMPRGLPERAEAYLDYQAVVLADVGADALSAGAQRALNRYVSELGGGLIATGPALRDDKFAGSTLEKTLPVSFRPQPPPPTREPIAIYLCIDRSNSMSYNSRYPAVRDGERIRYAKQAAIALLRQLDDTDYAGVVAFDSQPYVLSHLRPIGEDRLVLEDRVSRLEPGGGTDFKDSLELAEREVLESGLGVRQVILITDGDTNRQYHDHDALIADFAAKHVAVSTIRIGPDLANLRLLEDFAQATGGVFYRVQDIEKLPQLLVRLTRKAMDQTPQGNVRIKYLGHSTILSGISAADVPPLEFFAATAAKEGASVPLRIERGKQSAPLVAAWQYGLGRSAIFAADTDSLAALSWIRWDRYAEFWSQMVTWVMRQGAPGRFDLKVAIGADRAVELTAEKADPAPAGNLVCRITGPGPAFEVAMTQLSESVYRAETAALPRGNYTATLMRKPGDLEQTLAATQFAMAGEPPADAAEVRIRPPNLALLRELAARSGGALDADPARMLRRSGAMVSVRRPAQPYLLPLVIVLVLGEVFVRRRFTDL